MDWNLDEMQQNLEQFQEDVDKAAQSATPILTVMDYEKIKVILLSIIAVCLVVIVILMLKQYRSGQSIRANYANHVQSANPAAASKEESTVETLAELMGFLKSGDLTMEEYQELKRRVLNGEK